LVVVVCFVLFVLRAAGTLLRRYVPNCLDCQADGGRFCSTYGSFGALTGCFAGSVSGGSAGVLSAEGFCDGVTAVGGGGAAAATAAAGLLRGAANITAAAAEGMLCPHSCTACPGWTAGSDPRQLWLWVVYPSVLSPLIVTLLFPWLSRGGADSGADGSWFGRLRGWCGGARRKGYAAVPDLPAPAATGVNVTRETIPEGQALDPAA